MKMARALGTWDRKIYGPTYENGSWTIKMYQEMYNKLKSADIVTACKLEWLGLVIRMGGERRVKELLKGKTGGGRRKGKILDEGGCTM